MASGECGGVALGIRLAAV